MRTRLIALIAIGLSSGGWLTAEHTIWVPEVRRGADAWRAPTPTDSMPHSVAEAEAQGRQYPRSSSPPKFNATVVAQTIVGTAERRCVRADTARAARSGDFYTGNFAGWVKLYRTGMRHPPKMWWHSGQRPLNVPVDFKLRVSRIDTVGPAFVFASGTTTTHRVVHEYQREGYTWVTNDIDLPTLGTWLFVATSQDQWGCFVVML